jgi:cytidine deaminase
MKYDPKKLFELARSAREHAYAPYSHFKVGACLFADDGVYYSGCNVENASYPQGQCAEPTAIGNMMVSGGRHILAILVLTDTKEGVFPCGGCLQKLSEFVTQETQVLIANLQGICHEVAFQN